MKFVEHRVADRRVVRLIQKWLSAGVLEDGRRTRSEVGTVQGGSISPLLANIYLHYVFDLWVQRWRKKQAHGEVIVVRFADDFIVGFEHRQRGRAIPRGIARALCPVRLGAAPREDASDRVRPLGRARTGDGGARASPRPSTSSASRIAARRRGRGGLGCCDRRCANGCRRSCRQVKAELRQRMHEAVPEQGEYLRAVVAGHVRYYGVP